MNLRFISFILLLIIIFFLLTRCSHRGWGYVGYGGHYYSRSYAPWFWGGPTYYNSYSWHSYRNESRSIDRSYYNRKYSGTGYGSVRNNSRSRRSSQGGGFGFGK